MDSLYSAGGTAIRTSSSKGSKKFGHELDLSAKYAINKHAAALVGWAHFFPGGYIRRTGTSEDADLFYAQVEYKF